MMHASNASGNGLALAIVGSVMATFGLGVLDILNGHFSGGAYLFEQLVRVVGMAFLFLLALLAAFETPRLSVGLLLLGEANLLRGGAALWGTPLPALMVTLVTSSYLLVGCVGLIALVVGWRRGERLEPPKTAKSPSATPGLPNFLVPPRTAATAQTPPRRAVPVTVRLLQLFSLLSSLVGTYVSFQLSSQANFNEPRALVTLVSFLGLLMLIVVLILGVMVLTHQP